MSDASPRFRQDLEATATEAEGVPCVDVTDRRTGTNFRFYDFEYQLALQFNGQPLADVTAWASQTYGVDLTVEGINEFAGRLSELGFLESAAGAGGAPPAGGSKAADLESAEAEWMSAEGAKTASFVPEPGMLDSAADLTPVAPELPHLDEEGGAAADSVDVSTDEPTPAPAEPKAPEAPTPAPLRLFDIPLPDAPAPPPVKAPPPPAAKPASSWAMDLEGGLRSDTDRQAASAKSNGADMMTPPPMPTPPPMVTPPPLLTPPPVAKAPGVTPAAAGTKAGGAPSPASLPERRQPPAPEAVLMTAFTEDAAGGAAKPKRRGLRVAVLLILLLAIVGIVYLQRSRENARVPEAVRVRVLSPKPAAVYRWFPGPGTVTDHEARTLAFESAGTLAELLPPGTAFAAGDVLGKLRGAQPIEALVGRQRARVAFYQQMRDSMRAANNAAELRQAEIKLADKQRLVDESMASLAKLVLRASEPGEIVETLAKVGTPVRANVPLMRVKGRMLHGEFALSEEEIASVGKIGFCRVEVVGLGPRASNAEAPGAGTTAADVGSPDAQVVPRFIDCEFEKSAAGAKKLRVTLPENLGLVPGQPLRLARHRYDAVFPLAGAAIMSDSDKARSVWIAGAAGTAERRAVTVVDFEPVVDGTRVYLPEDALVTEGLRVGDEVIVGAPADLRPGAPIIVER